MSGKLISNAGILCLALFSATATASLDPADLRAFKEAGARFSVLLDQANSAGQVDDLRTPEWRDLVQQLSDEDRMLGSAGESPDDFVVLMEICGIAGSATASLIMLGINSQVDPEANPEKNAANLVDLANANIIRFQQELQELQPFCLRCLAKSVRPLTGFIGYLEPWEITPARQAGLVQMRAGVLAMFEGILSAVGDDSYGDDYRLALVSALAETSSTLMMLTQLPVREQISVLADDVLRKSEMPYIEYLEEVIVALSDKSCDMLCSL